jgi:single-strand DNA-binding protein
MNTVCLIGRLVADPELKYTPSGTAVCNFRIAVDRRFKSESGEKQTDFFDVVAWRQSAEFAANYLGKGRLVSVTGTLQQRSWVQQDGQKRSKIEVVAEQLQGLDKAQEQQGAASSRSEQPAEPQGDDYDPFAEE